MRSGKRGKKTQIKGTVCKMVYNSEFKIATLNCKGLAELTKREILVDIMEKDTSMSSVYKKHT